MSVHPDRETIAAVATPAGRGGIGIIRISGAQAGAIASGLLGKLPKPRVATLAKFRDADGEIIDTGLALYFPGPRSYTGENVLELHGHGGPVVLDSLLARVLILGARLARPGEFTERAFLNDKLDLAQAEAVADLIDAGSREAARAAQRSLAGEFSAQIQALVEEVIALRMYVEAAIDFPEEEVDFLSDGKLHARLDELRARFDALAAQARQGQVLREGLTVVIAGAPNVGKSSLLNALAGRDSAIVTDIPGTTRDVLREHISIDGLPLHVLDTAGLRDSSDPIEQEGMRRAWAEMERADLVLLVLDESAPTQTLPRLRGRAREGAALRAEAPVLTLRNKCDLSGAPAGRVDADELRISARTGAGLDSLREELKHRAGYRVSEGGGFLARRRHLDALGRARAALERGRTQLSEHRAGELLADELRQCQQALSEITGEFTSDDLLGRIFSSFCIGK